MILKVRLLRSFESSVNSFLVITAKSSRRVTYPHHHSKNLNLALGSAKFKEWDHSVNICINGKIVKNNREIWYEIKNWAQLVEISLNVENALKRR